MGSLNRAPKIHNQPSKGQTNKATEMLQAIQRGLNKVFNSEQKWHSKRAVRGMWLHSHRRSRYMPHQGAQECARRIRQMNKKLVSFRIPNA